MSNKPVKITVENPNNGDQHEFHVQEFQIDLTQEPVNLGGEWMTGYREFTMRGSLVDIPKRQLDKRILLL